MDDYSVPGPTAGSRVVTLKPDIYNDFSVTPPAINPAYVVGTAKDHIVKAVSYAFEKAVEYPKCDGRTTGNGFCGLQADTSGVSAMEDCDSGNVTDPTGSIFCDCHGLIRGWAVCVNTGTCDQTDSTDSDTSTSKCQFLDPTVKVPDATGNPGLQKASFATGSCTGHNQYWDQGVCVTAGTAGNACIFDLGSCTSGKCTPVNGVTPTCDPVTGTCSKCTSKSDCLSGTCTNGQCVTPISSPKHACGAINLQTNRLNCGTCGTACAPGFGCTAGVCTTDCVTTALSTAQCGVGYFCTATGGPAACTAACTFSTACSSDTQISGTSCTGGLCVL